MNAKPKEQQIEKEAYGTVTEAGTIRFERLLPGPIERVWAYLTESAKRGKWLAAGPMELWPGGKFELVWRNAELSPKKEEIPEKYQKYEPETRLSGHITRCEPPRLLSHTWEGGDSEVTYELFPRRLRPPRPDAPPDCLPQGHAQLRPRLAHPLRHPRGPAQRPRAAPLLVQLRQIGGGI